MGHTKRWTCVLALGVVGALLSSCTYLDIAKLAGDETQGRDNDTPGSALAREYLIQQLKPMGRGIDPTKTGDEAYTQAIPGGTNVIAVIPGSDLADEYVMVGAHYDHIGSGCSTEDANDRICNGATDNAAGVAALLGVGRNLAARSTRPRRSIILALWDREEDGLLGSLHYTQNPIIPLAKTVAYVNFDIQGSNVLPSLRNTSFAIAAETGGPELEAAVRSAIGEQTLDTTMLSSVFGQYRSDYAVLIRANVPSVFFTDATGPCYHTAQDEIDIVDFDKLDQQIAIALRVTRELANTDTPPSIVANAPLATYDDLLNLTRVIERAWSDRGRFSAADVAAMTKVRADLKRLVAEGRGAFGPDDVSPLLGAAAAALNVLTHGPCDGFLTPS